MNPEVSICIPAYRQVRYLRMVLDSVLIQTFTDFELIITDDSPGNEVEKLVSEYEFNGKLKYFKNQAPLGSPANWNYAISLAKGEYIKILHGDDFFISGNSLSKYVELLDNNPGADFGFSASEVWSQSNNSKKIFSCSPKHLQRLQNEPDFLFFRNVIGGPSATIFRNKIKINFDTSLKWLVDVDFYIRILTLNKNAAYCMEPLICTVDGAEGQITQSLIFNRQVQIKEHILVFGKLINDTTHTKKGKFLLFFKLLFYRYKLKSMAELNTITPIPPGLEYFFNKAISAVKRRILFTRIVVRFYNSNLNKRIFKMELF